MFLQGCRGEGSLQLRVMVTEGQWTMLLSLGLTLKKPIEGNFLLIPIPNSAEARG